MTLAAGTRLGPYKVLEPIGKGGMGEVYRARDTKLDRDVAIKVLPEKFANDDERLARFEREAKLLASLNHPNIASIHGFEESDGVKALVLELVEGPTLAERILQGLIPVDEAIAIAKQIAEALEAGHEAGVIHRDLKPANIKVREDGTVKVLDYGLAKALEGDAPSGTDEGLSQSPTLTRQGTQIGVILGTAAYMSPEQATGKRVDRRTDIWAFGAVVYEMLTGRRAFEGKEVSDTLAQVLTTEPDYSALPSDLDVRLRRVLDRCLRKDKRERLRDIGDVRLEFEDARSGTYGRSSVLPVAATSVSRWPAVPWIIVGLITAVTFALYLQRRPAEGPPLVRTSIAIPPGQHIMSPAISPDGRRIVYTALEGAEDDGRLYLRHLAEREATPIPGTEGGRSPFFSPDGEWVGFFASGQLKKVRVDGVGAVTLAAASGGGGSWGRDGTIVFSPETGSGVVGLHDDGSTSEVLTQLDVERQEQNHLWPQILPNGRAVLFTAYSGDFGEGGIFVQSLSGGESRFLADGGNAQYVTTGHIVYERGGSLYAVAFDLERLEVLGTSIPVQTGVLPGSVFERTFALSESGTLIYVPDLPDARPVVLADLDGQVRRLDAPPMLHRAARFSPDGREVVITTADYLSLDGNVSGSIYLYELEHARFSLLFSSFENAAGVSFKPWSAIPANWSPDGTQLAVTARGTGGAGSFIVQVDGSGVSRLSALDPPAMGGTPDAQMSWSPDGTRLLYLHRFHDPSQGGTWDIWEQPIQPAGEPRPLVENPGSDQSEPILSPDGTSLLYIHRSHDPSQGCNWDIWEQPIQPAGEPRPLVENPGSDESEPILSPDGRWLAYASNESGEEQVYVKPYGRPGGSRQLSIDWGTAPLWSPDGRTIYYRDRSRIMSVPIQVEPVFSAGRPRMLFDDALDLDPDGHVRAFDLSPDGRRFVMIGRAESTLAQIHVTQNWHEELKRLVPKNK